MCRVTKCLFTFCTAALALSSVLPDATINRGTHSVSLSEIFLTFSFLLRITWLNAFKIPNELTPTMSPTRAVFSVTIYVLKIRNIITALNQESHAKRKHG